MDLLRVESKCGEDTNVRLRCEHCGNEEVVYGKDTDAWYAEVKCIKCSNCGKSTGMAPLCTS